eukprot:2583530-Amphidinium_carterae.1
MALGVSRRPILGPCGSAAKAHHIVHRYTRGPSLASQVKCGRPSEPESGSTLSFGMQKALSQAILL